MLCRHGTVVVGAGIAGLACARRLHEAGQDFVVLSPSIGGRVLQSRDGAVPLGAFYVRADYDHVNPFVIRGRRIRSRHTLYHDAAGPYTLWDWRLLAHPAQATRFLRLLNSFRRHYDSLKADCAVMSQAQAIKADPFLNGCYHEPATEMVRRYGFEDFAHHYLAPALHGSAFLSMNQLSGFMLLLGALPTIVPTYEFTMRWDLLRDNLDQTFIADTVTAVSPTETGHTVTTTSHGEHHAQNVVVATGTNEAQRLLGLAHVKDPVRVHMFEIDGHLRPPFARAALNLFSDDQSTLAIVQHPDRPALCCAQIPDPDLDRYFTHWEVIEHHDWNPAFNLIGNVLLECEQAPNLYLIGDHNICGLEDAYISGIYAANQIISRSARSGECREEGVVRASELGDGSLPEALVPEAVVAAEQVVADGDHVGQCARQREEQDDPEEHPSDQLGAILDGVADRVKGVRYSGHVITPDVRDAAARMRS